MKIFIPGWKEMHLEHLVMDYNGTLAVDGELEPGVKELLLQLKDTLKLHVVTADTFGKASLGLAGIDCEFKILPKNNQQEGKLQYIELLGKERTVAMGNGRNDQLMLKNAALGIAVILKEGISVETMQAADVVCTSITSALSLLCNPLRLTATLRS